MTPALEAGSSVGRLLGWKDCQHSLLSQASEVVAATAWMIASQPESDSTAIVPVTVSTGAFLTTRQKIPIFAIDTGCGRMMGGSAAVEEYITNAVALGAKPPLIMPNNHKFHVANGETTESTGIVWLPGWCDKSKTEFQIDIGPWANVPCLLSIHVRCIMSQRGNATGTRPAK